MSHIELWDTRTGQMVAANDMTIAVTEVDNVRRIVGRFYIKPDPDDLDHWMIRWGNETWKPSSYARIESGWLTYIDVTADQYEEKLEQYVWPYPAVRSASTFAHAYVEQCAPHIWTVEPVGKPYVPRWQIRRRLRSDDIPDNARRCLTFAEARDYAATLVDAYRAMP